MANYVWEEELAYLLRQRVIYTHGRVLRWHEAIQCAVILRQPYRGYENGGSHILGVRGAEGGNGEDGALLFFFEEHCDLEGSCGGFINEKDHAGKISRGTPAHVHYLH